MLESEEEKLQNKYFYITVSNQRIKPLDHHRRRIKFMHTKKCKELFILKMNATKETLGTQKTKYKNVNSKKHTILNINFRTK